MDASPNPWRLARTADRRVCDQLPVLDLGYCSSVADWLSRLDNHVPPPAGPDFEARCQSPGLRDDIDVRDWHRCRFRYRQTSHERTSGARIDSDQDAGGKRAKPPEPSA